MKKYKLNLKRTFIILIIGCSVSLGCADIELEETPSSLLNPSNFFTTESEFEAALAGAFRPLYSSWGTYDYGVDILLSSGAEDVRSDADIFKNLNSLNANDKEILIESFWRQSYQSISNANVIIGNLKNATKIPTQKLGELEGQAKFLRAFSFFSLVRFFGEIQLTTFENQRDIENLKQATVADIYASIISDLKDAEAKLPVSFPEKGRPTQGAAKALLAKVYLTMAGWPLEEESNYALARDKAEELIMGGIYSLETNFADLWTQEKKLTTPEFIFTFYGSIAEGGSSGSHLHQATRHWGNGEEKGWGDFFSEGRFFNVFPEGHRKDASFTSVFPNGINWIVAGVQPHIAKYRDAGRTTGSNGEGFRPILRYADVLLIYAEAANMAEGSPSEAALEAVNKVRRRALGLDINMSSAIFDLSSGMSKSNFDKAVLDERNWELAFEANRWFDLVRRKMVVEVNISVHPGVTENNRLLPKPANELIPGVLTQNTGY